MYGHAPYSTISNKSRQTNPFEMSYLIIVWWAFFKKTIQNELLHPHRSGKQESINKRFYGHHLSLLCNEVVLQINQYRYCSNFFKQSRPSPQCFIYGYIHELYCFMAKQHKIMFVCLWCSPNKIKLTLIKDTKLIEFMTVAASHSPLIKKQTKLHSETEISIVKRDR